MAEIRVDANSFSLVSRWKVVTGSNGVKEITEGPSTASQTVNFAYELPKGSKVQRARVHSTWGSPLSGYAIKTVNGSTPDSNGMVDVTVDPSMTSVNVVFRFKANGNTSATGDRSASASVSDVYLLIETSGGGIHRVENGELVPYRFFHVENGVLVPYQITCG